MTASGEQQKRFLVGAICCCLIAAPFLVIHFPPITDLPQHTAQVRLFWEALGNPESPYRIQWFTPYSLVYGLLGLTWAFFGPESAGRIGALALGLLWVGATHLLAAVRRRPPEAALLASLLFFSPVLYWGFLSFVIGWPVFVLWVLLVTRNRARRFSGLEAALTLGAALLLYASHALWFAAGIAWLFVHDLAMRPPLRSCLLRWASVSPLLVAAALWYPKLESSGFVSPTSWDPIPTARLSFSWLAQSTGGALRGATTYVLFALFLGWLGLSLWQNRNKYWERLDRELALASALFLVFALLLPTEYMNTIEFSGRWAPIALVLFLLASPAPTRAPIFSRAAVWTTVAVACLWTATMWVRFERRDLSGLEESLRALPARPRVLGLDFLKESELIANRPFLQTFAYAQVMRGGTLNFSFAGFAPSPVIFKNLGPPLWTSGLEWFAEQVQPSDFNYFDYAVIGGQDDVHAMFSEFHALEPVTHTGHWRLYRITAAPQ